MSAACSERRTCGSVGGRGQAFFVRGDASRACSWRRKTNAAVTKRDMMVEALPGTSLEVV